MTDKGTPHTNWFKNAGVGVMLHYLKDIYAKEGGSEARNAAVNKFGTAQFANDFKKADVSYVMFALGQNSSYYCAPNAVYDQITGGRPGAARYSMALFHLPGQLVRSQGHPV